MANINFKQGEDAIISIDVIKDAVTVDISGVTSLKAILKVNGIDQRVYSLNAGNDSNGIPYGKLLLDGGLNPPGTSDSTFHLIVDREDSITFPVGVITVIALVGFTDDNFNDGERTEEFKFSVGRVQAGEGTNISMP